MKENVDIAFFIAKNSGEFDRYRNGNPELQSCTVGGNPVLFTRSSSPRVIVVSMYEAIRHISYDAAWRTRFWKNIEIIAQNTVECDLPGMVFIHWGNLDSNSEAWNSCAAFMASDKPDHFYFRLISSTSKLGQALGLGRSDPIVIPRGDGFLSWLDADEETEG